MVWSRGEAELAHARAAIVTASPAATFAKAEAEGSAAIQLDGKFIGYPIVYRAQRVLQRIAAIRAREGACGEVLRGLLAAQGDAFEALDFADALLDAGARLVEDLGKERGLGGGVLAVRDGGQMPRWRAAGRLALAS